VTAKPPDSNKQGFATRAIHAGQEPDPLTGAVSAPIYPTSTYAQEEIGKNKGYEYARVRTRRATAWRQTWRRSKAERHRASSAAAWRRSTPSRPCSKPATTSSPDTISTAELPRLFNQVLVNFGLTFTYVDTSDLKQRRESAFQKNTRLVFLETPTNPLMELCDLRALTELSHRHGVEVVVDNTFMSPYFQRPIEFGADMVVHSTTKFLNGHSDGLGGVVVCTKA
jgi:cystathionine beta-lyase/cystathionine gamma-synthase